MNTYLHSWLGYLDQGARAHAMTLSLEQKMLNLKKGPQISRILATKVILIWVHYGHNIS